MTATLRAARSAVHGPAAQCPRCKAWYSAPGEDLFGRPVEHDDARRHQCPPRWIARDLWGELILDPLRPGNDELRFWGVDAGAAAEAVVAHLVERGEVAETCEVHVRQLPAGVWLRVVVRVAWSIDADDARDDVEISAERVALAHARRASA